MDAIGNIATVATIAASGLGVVPGGKAKLFVKPLRELGPMLQRVERRVRRQRHEGAVRAVAGWVDILEDAIVASIPGARDVLPEEVSDAFVAIGVWAVCLAIGERYEPVVKGDADEPPARFRVAPGMLASLRPAGGEDTPPPVEKQE